MSPSGVGIVWHARQFGSEYQIHLAIFTRRSDLSACGVLEKYSMLPTLVYHTSFNLSTFTVKASFCHCNALVIFSFIILPYKTSAFALRHFYFSQKNSIFSPTGPLQKAMRAGNGTSAGIVMSCGSSITG